MQFYKFTNMLPTKIKKLAEKSTANFYFFVANYSPPYVIEKKMVIFISNYMPINTHERVCKK